MRAAVYARVSTERQGRDQTIDSQLEALRGWAAGHGHELKREHVFIDEGYSGSRLDRPALDRLRDAAREGEFDVVAVYSPDRLARRYAYQVLLLEEFRRAGCDVEFVHRPISDDPHDQLLLQIQGAVAEYERAVLGERFRRGKLQKARAGHWIAGQAPYGYRYVPARDGVPAHLEIDEAEAEVVRMLYRWLIDERTTVRQILKRLAAGPWRPRCGKRLWSPLRRPSDPLRPGLHRHRLRQPPRLRRAPQAAIDRPEGGDGDVPPGPAARGVDPDPGPGHHRRIDVSGREVATGPQLGPVVPEQQAQRLPAPVPAHVPGLRPGDVRHHDVRQARPGRAPVLQVPRQGHRGPRPGLPLHADPGQGRGARRGRLGARQGAARGPGDAGRAVRGAGPALGVEGRRPRRGPEVGGPTPAARPRGAAAGRRLPGRGDRPGRVEGPPRADPGPAAGPGHPARPGATAAVRASGGEGGLVGPRGVLPAGAVPARRGEPRGAAADLAAADRAGHSRGGLAGDPARHPAGPGGRGAVRPRPGGDPGAGRWGGTRTRGGARPPTDLSIAFGWCAPSRPGGSA